MFQPQGPSFAGGKGFQGLRLHAHNTHCANHTHIPGFLPWDPAAQGASLPLLQDRGQGSYSRHRSGERQGSSFLPSRILFRLMDPWLT